MISESLIEKQIDNLFGNIEFTKSPEGLYDPLRYMIGIGGKRIRPRLCLTAYALFKDSFSDGVCDAAEALEVFHTFTLIHDDIMDNAPKRRGVDTVWKKWDVNSAILSGDVMSIDSYRRLSKVNATSLPSVLELFSKTAAQVCEGQQMDMEFESELEVGMNRYIEMIGLKTAVLIACSAKMGALIAGASERECELLYNYGYNLGLAFQIADDYLDTFGDEKTFGKSIGGDILNDKKTWLLTKAMEKDAVGFSAVMKIPTGTQEQDKAKIAAVSEAYRKLKVDKEAIEAVRHYTALAMEEADKLELGKIRYEMLARYADKLVGRTK